MHYIYKITNLITNKIYIGYTSRTLERRFYEHKYVAIVEKKDGYLYNSMRKYGVENFIIEKVHDFEDESQWQDLEKKYIKDFNSLAPNGYNMTIGGDKPPIRYGNDNNKTKIKDEDLPKLIEQLQTTYLSYSEIADNFNISTEYLYELNQGKHRKMSNIDYPIREYTLQETYALEVMKILSTDTTLSNSKIAELIPNYFRSNEIASINNGKKYKYLWNGDFPIRKTIVPNDYEEKQNIAKDIVNLIEDNKSKGKRNSQIDIQRNTGYKRSVVEKTIKGIYPYSMDGYKYPLALNN